MNGQGHLIKPETEIINDFFTSNNDYVSKFNTKIGKTTENYNNQSIELPSNTPEVKTVSVNERGSYWTIFKGERTRLTRKDYFLCPVTPTAISSKLSLINITKHLSI